MKHYLKKLIIVFISLYLAYSLVPTINLGSDPKNIFIIIATFLLISIVIRPVFSLVLLPINFLTLGLVSLGLNMIAVFALINALPGVKILAYDFPGINYGGIIIRPTELNEMSTIILAALIITISQKTLHFIFE